MRIEIVSVGPVETMPGKRPYKKLSVLFNTETGRQNTKFIVDFSNPGVFKTLLNAKPGDEFEVKTQKNEKGYDEWVRIIPVETGNNTAATAKSPTLATSPAPPLKITVTESDRQRSIVRQTSIKAAVEFLRERVVEGKGANAADVLFVAQIFEDFINRPVETRIVPTKTERGVGAVDKQAGNEEVERTARKSPGRPRKVVSVDPEDRAMSRSGSFDEGDIE